MGTRIAEHSAATIFARHDIASDPGQTAEYTADLLKGLRGIAERQNQAQLAHLLRLAEYEARWQAKNSS